MSAVSLGAPFFSQQKKAPTVLSSVSGGGGLPSEAGWRLQKSMSFPLRSFPHLACVGSLSKESVLTVFRGCVLSPPSYRDPEEHTRRERGFSPSLPETSVSIMPMAGMRMEVSRNQAVPSTKVPSVNGGNVSHRGLYGGALTPSHAVHPHFGVCVCGGGDPPHPWRP
jgi:hypothetical protein